jgi:predicted Zn-dependent protease
MIREISNCITLKSLTILRFAICSVMLLLFLSISSLGNVNQIGDSQSGVPIRWKSGKIRIALSESLKLRLTSGAVDLSFVNAIKRSLRTWEAAGEIEFVESWSSEVSASRNGKPGDGINLITIAPTSENLSLFEENPFETSSRTKVYFNSKGFISEADIVLNPLVQFSTNGTYGTIDLESTVTHEIGHLLGLDHSFVLGSVMFSHQAKNTSTLESNYFARSLSSDDLFGLRSLYGANSPETQCCGVLAGRISQKNSTRVFKIWLEDLITGNVVAGFDTKNDGSFRVSGLSSGIYRAFVTDQNQTSNVEFVGVISIKRGSITSFVKAVKLAPSKTSVLYLGQNEQVANISIKAIAGSTVSIKLSGTNLNADELEVYFDSPFLSVTKGSVENSDFGQEIDSISFQVKVAESATYGNYSIKLLNREGQKTSVIGGITIVDK